MIDLPTTDPATELARLQFALQSAQIGTWTLDISRQQVWWDARCKELYGFGQHDIVSYDQVLSYVHEEDRQRVNEAVHWALNPRSGGNYDIQFRTVGADDGLIRWLQCRGRADFDAHGLALRFAGTAQDITSQVLASQALENGQRHILSLFEQSPVGLATLRADEQLTFGWANAFYGELVARPPQELMGQPLLKALPELVGQGFDILLQNVIQTGTPFSAHEVAVNIHRNGQLTTIYVDLTYQPRRAVQGHVEEILVVATDVTQQVISRRTLEENRAQLRSIVEEAPFAMGLHVGAELRIELANDTQLSYWHKDRSVMGKPFRVAMPELEGQGFFELFELAYATGQPYQGQAAPAQLSLDGQPGTYYFDYSFKPIRNEQGQVYAVLNTAINVTPQVLARQAQKQQQDQQRFVLRLADAIRPLSDPLAVYYQTACLVGQYLGANRVGYAEDQGDGNTIVVLQNYVNGVADLQGTYQYADYGPLLTEFLAGRTVVRSDIAQDPTLTAVEKEAHRVLQLGATLNKPLIKDGRLIAVLFIHYQQVHDWSAEELSLLDGVAERLVVAIERTQIETELRQSEARYRQLSAQLDEQVQQRTQELATTNKALMATNESFVGANQALVRANSDLIRSNQNLEQFAYIASHDLQEPLRKIQQFGDLLKTRFTHSVDGQEGLYLERMQLAASRMSVLIRDLLAFSRIATTQAVAQPVSLQEVIHQALESLSVAIEESGAQIEVYTLPTVPGEALQLGQLFQNLLANALKFRRTGLDGALLSPHITVRSHQLARGELPASAKPTRDTQMYHRIEVIDNGIGFEEKYLDRIFQVFQRLHGKNEFAGTGVGLAIVQKVVTNHGGAITAISGLNQGATFSVYLPA